MSGMPQMIITPRDSLTGYDRIDIDLGDTRVGNCRCRMESDRAIIFSIQIFPEHQGKGYGRHAVAFFKERYPLLIADRVRFTARDFWQKMGFVEAEESNWRWRRPNSVSFTR